MTEQNWNLYALIHSTAWPTLYLPAAQTLAWRWVWPLGDPLPGNASQLPVPCTSAISFQTLQSWQGKSDFCSCLAKGRQAPGRVAGLKVSDAPEAESVNCTKELSLKFLCSLILVTWVCMYLIQTPIYHSGRWQLGFVNLKDDNTINLSLLSPVLLLSLGGCLLCVFILFCIV